MIERRRGSSPDSCDLLLLGATIIPMAMAAVRAEESWVSRNVSRFDTGELDRGDI